MGNYQFTNDEREMTNVQCQMTNEGIFGNRRMNFAVTKIRNQMCEKDA